MFSSLRARLLLSYLALIGLTLCIIGLALYAILLNNPVSTRLVYLRLYDIARANARYLREDPLQLDRRLAEVAVDNQVRALRLAPGGVVLFDSAGVLRAGQALALNRMQAEGEPVIGEQGTYREPGGREWLYVGFRAQRPEMDLIILALPRPRLPPFNAAGNNLLRPLVQAGAIGLVVSIIFAVLISSSVAGPLRQIASAARALANGDYSQHAPEEGPREVRELAHAFNEMARQVQRSQETQRDFLANVSHELKTPLTSIQGFSQAILDGAASNPAHAAQIIHDEAGRMRRLVEDLLDLARIESGQARLCRERVNLDDLLDGVLQSFSLRAAEQDVALKREMNGLLPTLVGDGDRLAQVFTNLIDNALTHTPPGGRVTLYADRVGNGIRISVSDTGRGIPPEDQGRVFERFYQVDKSRARDGQAGTGLGLTIGKEIVEAHGGTIGVESVMGRGATFHVWLPLPRPQDETVPRASVRR